MRTLGGAGSMEQMWYVVSVRLAFRPAALRFPETGNWRGVRPRDLVRAGQVRN